MDMRIVRTRKNIIDAFIELRSKKELEKITIKELAEKAFINKATFYQHYKDIYDLSDQLQNEAIETVLNQIDSPMGLLSGSREGFRKMAKLMTNQTALFDILFSGSQSSRMVNLLEAKLKQNIYAENPQYRDDLKMEILLSVCIQGAFATCCRYRNSQFDEALNILSEINEKLLGQESIQDD